MLKPPRERPRAWSSGSHAEAEGVGFQRLEAEPRHRRTRHGGSVAEESRGTAERPGGGPGDGPGDDSKAAQEAVQALSGGAGPAWTPEQEKRIRAMLDQIRKVRD